MTNTIPSREPGGDERALVRGRVAGVDRVDRAQDPERDAGDRRARRRAISIQRSDGPLDPFNFRCIHLVTELLDPDVGRHLFG